MLRVNLDNILKEKGITASRIAHDTGISPTTLSALVNNTGKGVQFDTIDSICNYLKITPDDFFEYVPFDYRLGYHNGKIKIDLDRNPYSPSVGAISDIEYTFDFFITLTTVSDNLTFDLIGEFHKKRIQGKFYITLSFNNPDDKIKFNNIVHAKLNDSLKNDFYENISELIFKSFSNELDKEFLRLENGEMFDDLKLSIQINSFKNNTILSNEFMDGLPF